MAKTNYLHWLSAPWEPCLLTEGWLELELAGDRAHMIQTQQRQRSEITRPTRSNSHWNRQRVPTSPTYLQQDPLWAELHFHIATKRKVPAYTNCFRSLSLQPPSESSKWADRCSGAMSNLNFSQQKTLKHGISTNSLAFLKSIWVSSVSCLIFLQCYKQTAQHISEHYTALQCCKSLRERWTPTVFICIAPKNRLSDLLLPHRKGAWFPEYLKYSIVQNLLHSYLCFLETTDHTY